MDVIDNLPPELDPNTFEIVNFQAMNGITSCYPNTLVAFKAQGNLKTITFQGTPGLPGLEQPGYAYDQTIFSFKFKVKTKSGIRNTFRNTATIVFYDELGEKMEQIITNDAKVKYIEVSEECTCWKAFWRNFFNIFRRNKLEPCTRSQKGT